MEAINAAYPNITILMLHGPSVVTHFTSSTVNSDTPNGLLISFVDGMCEAADASTTIVDLHEYSYGYRTMAQYATVRPRILVTTKALSAVPEKFEAHIRVGMAIWLNEGSVWDSVDFSKNYYSPEQFRQCLSYALECTDKYVWVYSETPVGWWYYSVPPAYLKALGAPTRTISQNNDRQHAVHRLTSSH